MNTYGTSVGKRNYKNEPDGKPRVEKKNDYNEKKKKKYRMNLTAAWRWQERVYDGSVESIQS